MAAGMVESYLLVTSVSKMGLVGVQGSSALLLWVFYRHNGKLEEDNKLWGN